MVQGLQGKRNQARLNGWNSAEAGIRAKSLLAMGRELSDEMAFWVSLARYLGGLKLSRGFGR